MKKVILAIFMAGLMLITIFSVCFTASAASETQDAESVAWNINDDGGSDGESEYWALIIAPTDVHGDLPFEERGRFYEEALLSFGSNWKEENIIGLYGEAPTTSNVIQAIQTIAEKDAPSDTTLISINTHGGKYTDTGKGYFRCWDRSMDYEELATELDKLDSKAIGIVISACHSGSAILDLQDDGRVIITSCRAEETGGFDSEVALGLQGFADYCINGGNKNGVVSMEEAFGYIMHEKFCNSPKHPQIQDDYLGELNIVVLDQSKDHIDQIPNYTFLSDWFGIVKVQYVKNVLWEDEVAQSFKPSVDVLTKVRLRIKNYDSQSSIIVSIRKELDGVDLTSKILLPNEIQVQANSIINKKYTVVNFPDINVIPGETYYIVCKIAEPEPNIHTLFSVEGRNDNCYSRGMCYVRSASQQGTPNPEWIGTEDVDLLFVTYGRKDENDPPNTPIIDGSTSGNPGTEYDYTFVTIDPDGDDVYYYINWGDETYEEWIGAFNSGEVVTVSHIWDEQGTYEIKAKAKDVHGAESDWAILSVSMPKNTDSNDNSNPLDGFLNRDSTFSTTSSTSFSFSTGSSTLLRLRR